MYDVLDYIFWKLEHSVLSQYGHFASHSITNKMHL